MPPNKGKTANLSVEAIEAMRDLLNDPIYIKECREIDLRDLWKDYSTINWNIKI